MTYTSAKQTQIVDKDEEIERLRAALTELALLGEQGMKPNYGEWLTFHDKVAKVARAALVGDGQSLKPES